MTTTTTTVDTLLRARSDANLSAELNSLLAPIRAMITILDDTGDATNAGAAVDAFKTQMMGFLSGAYQEDEIAAFLDTVASQQFVEAS